MILCLCSADISLAFQQTCMYMYTHFYQPYCKMILLPNLLLTEQNIRLFRHSAYIAHSPNTNTAWKRKEKRRTKTKSIIR